MKKINSEINKNFHNQNNRLQYVSRAMSRLFRGLNLINPTSYARHYVTEVANKLEFLPAAGNYKVDEGVTMQLHMEDYIERSIYFDSFEFACRRILKRFLKQGSIFLDIGANVGYYSLLANSRVGSFGRVLSFEANPVTAKKMKLNIDLSSAKQIELFEIALSNTYGQVQIYCPKNETHGFASMRNQGWKDADSYLVTCKRLDDVLPTDLTHIDLIKIDVEGAELLVFDGAKETISKFKPPILLELNKEAAESFGYDTLEMVNLLLSLNINYKMKFIDAHATVPITIKELFSKSLRNGNLILY